MTGGLLALDVATITGWAYGAAGERPDYGHFTAAKRGMVDGQIIARFRDWLDECFELWKPATVAFESPYVGRMIDIKVLRRLMTLNGLVEELAWRHRVRCREEASNVICRQFTGNGSWGGRAKKKAATKKMCAVYGFPDVTEDEADALALWHYAEAALFPTTRSAGPLFALGERARFT